MGKRGENCRRFGRLVAARRCNGKTGKTMAWNKTGSRRYYYRSKRTQGRVVHEYFGDGHVAEMAATAAAVERLTREINRRERAEEQAKWRAVDEAVIELCRVCDMAANAALIAAGYYRHDRGSWRRRREPGKS